MTKDTRELALAATIVIALLAVVLGGVYAHRSLREKSDINAALLSQSVGSGGQVLVTGSGLTSLNGLTGGTQTFVDDTNITVVSSGTTHTITWSGTLASSRGGLGGNFGSATGVLVDLAGTVSASTSPQMASFTATSTTLTSSANILGVASTSAWGILSVEQGTEAYSLLVGNNGSTTPSLSVNGVNGDGRIGFASSTPFARLSLGSGTIVVPESTIATSSSFTIDWRNTPQPLVRIGTGGVTINFTGYIAGQILRVWVCNPAVGTAGTVTWGSGIIWTGGSAPSQTTTANKCDLWTFNATNGTSTLFAAGSSVTSF